MFRMNLNKYELDKLKEDFRIGVDYLNNSRNLIEKIKGIKYGLTFKSDPLVEIHITSENRKLRRQNIGIPIIALIYLTDKGIKGHYSAGFKHVTQVIGATELISFSEMNISSTVDNNPFLS